MTARRAAHDVVIVGGGVIGLAVAWRAATAGMSVAVVDPRPGTGASRVAGGMIAPVTEVHFGEQPLLEFGLASAAAYPEFVAELEEFTGLATGYRQDGILAVALDADDRAALRQLYEFQLSLGLRSRWLTSRECRHQEPMLAPGVTGGLLADGDHQIDNRALTRALLAAAERAGARLWRSQALRIQVVAGRAVGVYLAEEELLSAGQVLLAAGAWSGSVPGLPAGAAPPVRPVKGQILRLRTDPDNPALPRRTVRGTTRGSHVYLVPRRSGELVVGATVEEQGFQDRITAGGLYQLLRDAHDLVPGVMEFTMVESGVGFRPGTPDNAPILGPSPLPGLGYACGHYRNGILLAPATAEAVTAYLTTGSLPPPAAAFTLDRLVAPGVRA